MKTLLLIIILTIPTLACPTATIYGGVFGKTDIGDLAPLKGVKRVLFVRDNGVVYSAPVIRGYYSIDLEKCGTYEVSAFTLTGYYFEMLTINLTQTDGFEMNIYGLRRRIVLNQHKYRY